MKNYRTPRTLSDSEFTTGYPSIPWHDRHVYRTRKHTAIGATLVSVALFAAIGLLLAWRG